MQVALGNAGGAKRLWPGVLKVHVAGVRFTVGFELAASIDAFYVTIDIVDVFKNQILGALVAYRNVILNELKQCSFELLVFEAVAGVIQIVALGKIRHYWLALIVERVSEIAGDVRIKLIEVISEFENSYLILG